MMTRLTMMNKYILWPVLALSVLSCGKEAVMETPEPQPAGQEARDPWTFYPEEETVRIGKPHTVVADFDVNTKSQLADEGGGNFSVNWTANDEFRVYGFGSGSILRAVYTTTESGKNVEFITTNDLQGSTTFHALYPESASINTGTIQVGEDKYQAFWVQIPSSQTATAGSVAEEANISYAHPASLDECLVFKNVISLLKFRLSGAIANQVKSVTLTGVNDMAGGYAVIAPNGEPEILPNVSQRGFDKTNSITLSGTFEAGKDYFIALAPCVQQGISMVFANGNQTITKTSTKTFRFDRSGITDFGTIKLGDAFNETVSTDPIKYIAATASAPRPVSIVVLPDGYTAAELPEYELKAKAGIDALFNTEPFKSYRSYFNVWILKVASNESGANVTDGKGNIIEPKDCYFGSRWGRNSYNDLNANDTKIYDFVKANCPDLADNSHTINEVPVLLIINDDRYGGIARSNDAGRSYCLVPTTKGYLRWSYPARKARTDAVIENPSLANDLIDTPQTELDEVGVNTGTWMNTLVHEFGGHSFGRLGDEYWYDDSMRSGKITGQTWDVPFNLNLAGDPDNVPWQTLMTTTSGVSAYRRMGIFQGADVSPFNRWRSERVSCMIDNRFYFSAYQRYLIVQRIHTLAGDTPAAPLADFLLHDVTTDPVRDEISSGVIGVSDAVPPRPVPMLPPPVLEEE